MHNITLQNITSQDRMRRDLVIEERLDGEKICARSEKHFTYIINNRHHILNPAFGLKYEKSEKALNRPATARHFYIIRKYNTKEQKAEYEFKTSSNLYIVSGRDIFYVTLFYTLTLDIINSG